METGLCSRLTAGIMLTAFLAGPAALAASAEQTVEVTVTAEKGTNGNEDGFWITVRETLFDWELQVYRDVVAYYRAYRGGWLDEMTSGKWGKANTWNHTAVRDENLVRETVLKASWGAVNDYVKKNVPSAWQNQGVVLLDPETGEIIGHMRVENSYDATNKVMGALNRETAIEIIKGKNKNAEKVRIVASSVWASPIVLDLTGAGKPDLLAGPRWKLEPGRQLAANALRPFDLDGKGMYSWEWVGPNAGILAWDPDGTGKIRSGEQLFGNYTWGKRWRDGYDALATLDTDGDGNVTESEFSHLAVWVDADSSGTSDAGEVRRLADMGIVSLNVRASRDSRGNASAAKGFVRKVGGKSQAFATWDWMAMGQALASEGTYVWVGEDGEKKLGGYLVVHEEAGEVRGYSIPTIGTAPLPGGILPMFPISGKRVGDAIEWTLPSEDGQVKSAVRWEAGGKHLYGVTRAETNENNTEYMWQAELIAGKPVGVLPAPRAAGVPLGAVGRDR
jgi:hypothetical protein